ncbi:conserved hypothetical protein [Talaromyces stipitatus ATCC 10500]|uniref:Uncharacterized protein n=1 Tax=Talaromyces stipitatus (strain ATCC 10500 / CBS 375.48 / QM 6759 / NRRL 1006) TaxID=441959 RepID=B8MK68_TALSN|nr:uncharacterized protein TSTA_043560 [Talaromyces stipitatus ATCC 10500]EED14885.1 conserved hypothetical protein [Talaromyces stipitatus ATCC 10500]
MYKMLRRTTAPAVRCARQQPRSQARFVNRRFQSTTSQATSSASNPALIGGIAGYAWYHFSGAKTLVKTSKETHAYIKQAKQKIVEKTPEPDEAFRWLRDTVKSYAVFIPGGRGYVDTAFDDLEKIRNNHKEEFDRIVKDAYNELGCIFKKDGFSTTAASNSLPVLQQYAQRLFDLAGDAAEDVLSNHPQLKEKVGGSYDQLKQMGEACGPRAKEEVDQTWQQISSIIKRGVSVQSAEEIKSLIEDKKNKLQKLGDEAWKKGLDESQERLFPGIMGPSEGEGSSGKSEDVEKYIKDKVEQAKNSDMSGLDQWLNKVPGGSDLLSQLQSLQTIAQKKGSETEKIMKETLEELQAVLKKGKEQVEKLTQE